RGGQVVKAQVVRWPTCQCPGTDDLDSRGRVVRLARKREERRDGNGKLVAVTCARCTLPVVIICRACDLGTTDIDELVKASPKCARDVAYRATRATGGGA